jgi:hypothetical protein
VSSTTIELIGYLASALVVLSLIMSSVLRLRVIGLTGAIVFATYGALIASVPVMVTNGAIVLVHGYHLVRILRARASDSYFEVVRWPVFGTYLPRFLDFHRDDIARSQPNFDGLHDDHLAWVILRDAEPVGVVLARRSDDGSAHIDLDYVRPEHRDLRAGKVFFSNGEGLSGEGIGTVTTDAPTDLHRRYLIQMGFEPVGDGTGRWQRPVA